MTKPGLAAVFAREVKGICANAQLVIFCFIMPVFWVLVVWLLLGNGVMTHAPVGLVDQENSPESRKVIQALSACRAIAFQTYVEPDAALGAMRAGAVYGVLVVPPGYGRTPDTSMVMWLDENRYAVAGTIHAQLNAAMQSLNLEQTIDLTMKAGAAPAEARRMVSAVHSDFYALGNPQESFLAFLGSNLIPSLIMIGAMFSFVTAFLRELWHSSVNEWFAAANWRIIPAVTGKLLPYFGIYIFIYLFYLALFSGQGGFNITGNLFTLSALGLGCLADFAAAAIIVAAIAPTWRMALVISAGYVAPALPFTGFSMPLDSMSHAVALFGRCLPLTWYVQGQAQQWTLSAPLTAMHSALSGMFCIFVISVCIGLPCLRFSYGRRARVEANT